MRLTLRTLLAYLDDILPASEAKEIGTQIGNVPEAAVLMRKLQEVIRKRRLSAPPLSGPGSGPDPNIVAEYLESTLPPAAVVELETLCYRSDMHLAEVAACHKILTLVLGEPIEVSQEMKERMHALGSVSKTPLPVAADPDFAAEHAVAATAAEPPLFEQGIPDYLRTPAGSGQWWTALLVVGLAGVWIGLSWPELQVWLAPKSAEQLVASTNPAPAVIDTQEQEEPQPTPAEPEPTPAEPAQAVTTVAEKTPADQALAANVVSPDRVTPGSSAEKMPAPANEPATPEPATPGGENAPAPPAPEAVPVVPALAIAQTFLEYVAADDVLLVRDETMADWLVVTSPQTLAAEKDYAVPVPFHVYFTVGAGAGVLELLGHTAIRSMPVTAENTIALELQQGRVRLIRPAAMETPLKAVFHVQGQVWQLELSEPGTTVGLDVAWPLPTKPGGVAARPEGGFQVLSGICQVQLAGSEQAVQLRPESGVWKWSETEPSPLVPGLAWLGTDPAATTNVAKQNARAYLKEFQPNSSVSESIGPVVDDRRETLSEFALRTMEVTSSVPEMVRGLHAEHEVTRVAAIDALRRWLGHHPGGEMLVAAELERVYNDEDVNLLIRLLWGYNQDDARNPEVSQQLVQLLGHEDIAVRELAFYHASRLSGRKYDYRAMLPPHQRAAAEKRWYDHLEREGALVR